MATVLHGLSTDIKPLGVPKGTQYHERDTRELYEFDGEVWVDMGDPGESDFTEVVVGV